MILHTGNPKFRNDILTNGLMPTVGDSYRLHWESIYPNVTPVPAVFAIEVTDVSDAYDSTYDDDIWEIIGIDRSSFVHDKAAYSGCIVTYDRIKPENLRLIYEGTGKSK